VKAVDAYSQAALQPDSKSYEKESVLLLHKLMHSCLSLIFIFLFFPAII
jgi:hypothetical protein